MITTAELEDDFADLVFWHNRKGVRDTVITVEYIYANYAGADNQDKIRDYLAKRDRNGHQVDYNRTNTLATGIAAQMAAFLVQ